MSASRRPRPNIDGLIFSCYDLLIDARHSYREVTRKTVELYLERAVGLGAASEPLLTAEEVTLLQKVGGFSNYWDLTNAFIIYFIEMLPPIPAPTFPSKFHVPAILAYLQFAGGNLRISIDSLREQRDIAQLAKNVAAAGGGIDGAHKVLPKENRHLLVSVGTVTKTNIVGRVFQELYLGAELFERKYGEPAIMVQNTGYAEQESLLIDPTVLEAISKKIPLGVVSDRPRNEVEHSLESQNIKHYFQSIVTRDEIREAKANPIPAPWSLLEAARFLQPIPAHSAYVGAGYADIQAAQAAGKTVPFTSIGCLEGAHDKTEMNKIFEQHKANMILGHPNHLKELILG
jgi:phosphoglycolate phosphatase-like HAD superfamily hydrolase